MNLVKKFGEVTSRRIKEKPIAARRNLAAAFRGYGSINKIINKKDLPARNYMMWACNKITAKGLMHPEQSAIVSIFTPCEVLHAMDILPVFPEGMGCYMSATGCETPFVENAEAGGVPETLCSYHKLLIGLAETGVLPRPMFIINTTMACDANQVSFRRLAEYFKVPHFVLDIPTGCTKNNMEYLTQQLAAMTAFIEEHSGRQLSKERLTRVMENAAESIKNYSQALSLKAERFELTKMTSHMVDAFALHVLLGTEETLKYTRNLVGDLSKLPKERKSTRILWVHTIPYWQESMCQIFNYNENIEIVACDMNLDDLISLNPDQPYDSMAKWLLQNAFNGSATRRIQRSLEYAEKLSVDGILYFCHWGCKQTLGASAMAKEVFEKAGYPCLVIDGDGCDRRNIQDGQMVTRIQAFLEQLEGTK